MVSLHFVTNYSKGLTQNIYNLKNSQFFLVDQSFQSCSHESGITEFLLLRGGKSVTQAPADYSDISYLKGFGTSEVLIKGKE